MSAADEPMAPWAFRAALSGLPESQARDILESDRCPEPEPAGEWTDQTRSLPLDEEGDDLIICRRDREGAWIQSSRHVSLDDAR